MRNFWYEVLGLPYKSNSQDNPLHEEQVESLLKKHDLKYIAQPNGIQASPDFRVFLPTGKTVDIECKSSKNTYPTYNGGLPKKGVVYVFSSKRYDETTVFFAEDVVSDIKRELYRELVSQLNEVLIEYQENPIWKDDDRGFDFYIRNMYTQSGAGKKDYFSHSDRERCEQNVLNHQW